MPPYRYSSQNTTDIAILDLQALDTPDGLSTALRAIEAVCHRGDYEIAEMVEALNSRSNLLEYIVSALEERAYAKFSKWMLTGFPTSTTPNMNASSMQLLQRFSSSLLSVEYPSAADVPPNLRQSRRKVESSFDILKNLEEDANSALTGEDIHPVGRKKGKAVARGRQIDPIPFDSMEITVPTTDVEVRAVYVKVLLQLRGMLENYLLVLRKPALSQIFKSAYIKAKLPSEGMSPPTTGQPAFPTIQPMKTTLYFDDIEGFGEWLIQLSTQAQNDLRDVRRADRVMFRNIMKKIKQLSQGHFAGSNQSSLTSPKTKLPIYEAMVTDDTRLVYYIDCIPDIRNTYEVDAQHECQVIRVFGTFTLAQLYRERFWDNLGWQLQQRGPDYINRCTFRNKPLSTGDNIILPALFPPLPFQVQGVRQVTPSTEISEEDMKDIHSMLVLDKFVVLSQALLNSILADKDVAHVFSVSGREQEIIEHPSSCYVIGRSGTGKTTTMLFKMLGIQRIWQRSSETRPKPRQIFITQSRVLATKVEEYFAKLMSSLEASAYSPKELRMIERDVEQEDELVNQEDNKQWRSDLPERFSELLDDHFPLFITYDLLCTMLQNDIRWGDQNDGFIIPGTDVLGDEAISPTSPTSLQRSRLRAGSGSMSSSDYMQQFRRNFVSYGEFLAVYWDHLPQTFTRGLDPALVFGEFMGVIKGSEDTIGTKYGYLDQESYKSLSARSQATFSHKRDEIYDLFMSYTKLKGKRQDYDAADRTHYILGGLSDVGLAGRKVDFLYVDEVQDNLLIDTLILRKICANPDGLFWAGDTAQTISIGSSFRFADLKSYQHRIEKQLSRESGLTPAEPRTFELVLNYRSHSGIVNCARSVIELIMRYWPYSIDALQPEGATTEGRRPIFFVGREDVDLEKSFFGNSQGEPIDFGADQCILVRNDAVKDRLQQRLRGSLILTLYESKGLEFNDVLLYNFFEDSTATVNQWRLVLHEVSNRVDLSGAPTFDETRHASICVELKFLYVAITRARNKLWIVDSSESAEPMKIYWSSNDQIEIWSSTAEIPRLAVSSTSEEWLKTGKTMFLNKRYAQASVAYLNAGRKREAAICNAYLLRERARSISTTAGTARTQAFITAANNFISCASDAPSKQVKERLAYYGAAGECYSEACDLKNAGDSYRMAKQYTAAARAYREGGYFDELVEVITRYGDTLDSGLLERLTVAAQMHYFKHLNIKAALKLFPSEENALEFLDDYDLDEARVKLLEELGRVLELAEIHARSGDILTAVEILAASAAESVNHVLPATDYLLTGLRGSLTLGVLPTSHPIASKLLALADRLEKSAMTEQQVGELEMFEAIRGANHASLRTIAKTFIRTRNSPAALLCLDHVFSSPLKLENLSHVEVQASLSLYHHYVRLLNKFRGDESFAEGSNHQKLFGFRVLEENRYLAPRHTILHEKLAERFAGSNRKNAAGYPCSSDVLRQEIVQLIGSRISDRTKIQNGACRDVYGFSPCLRLLVEKKCDSPNGEEPCTFQHVQPEQLTIDWCHARLRLILLQFQILYLARYDDLDVKNYWLGVLYSALHPPFQSLGLIGNLDIATIPGAADGFRIVREWVQSVCYDPNYNSGSGSPLEQPFTVACMLAFDLDRENARHFIPRTPFYKSTREEENSAMQNFVAFLAAKEHRSLTCGSSYLREVLSSGLRVDLNALCDLVERLSGLFIMALRFNPHRGVLHNVTLPRSWFTNLVLPGTNFGKDTSTFYTFADTMIELMQRIDAQVRRYPASPSDTEEQFIANGDQITDTTGPLYIARICLCLCLMGYNASDSLLKKGILTGIQSLRRGDGQATPWIYERYAGAKSWDDLVHAFTESLKNATLDEIILLLHIHTYGASRQQPKHVRPVFYEWFSDVPKLVLPNSPNTLRTGATLAHRRRPHVEATAGARPGGNHGGQEQQKHIDIPEERIEEAEAVVYGGDHGEIDEARVNAARVIQDAYRRHLDRKWVVAIRKIQAAYRRHLKRKSIVRVGIDATQAQYWRLLHERSREMEWFDDSRYYLLFRVPLAYILVCLDTIEAFAESRKKGANRRMKNAGSKDLGEVMEVRNQYCELLKKTTALRKELSPSSPFHEAQSVDDLQQTILEVKAVVESLNNLPESIVTRNRIEKRWDRGSKWIFEKQGSRAKGKEAEKPEPVSDREDLLYLHSVLPQPWV